MKLFAFTLDLESDYAGYVDKYEIFRKPDKIEHVLSVLSSLGVKITVFVVGEILEQYPDIIKLFEKYNCEFEPHSYSHDFNDPDSESEIEKAKSAYYNYFKKDPQGYRAPRGKISDTGIGNLEKHGFLYDSSIFPSYFPDPFRYLFCKKQAHYHSKYDVMEIPFTSITPLRITLSISHIKLFGVDFFIKMSNLFSLPDSICFDSHLHDFILNKKSYDELSLFWKLVYGRNKFSGIDCCVKYLEHIKQQGYRFCYMFEIYNNYSK